MVGLYDGIFVNRTPQCMYGSSKILQPLQVCLLNAMEQLTYGGNWKVITHMLLQHNCNFASSSTEDCTQTAF